MSSQKIAETTEAQMDLVNDEVLLTNRRPHGEADVVAFRGRSRNGGVVKLCADALRDDGRSEELGFLFGKRDERYDPHPERAAGQWEFQVRVPGGGSTDGAMRKVFGIRHDGPVVYDAQGREVPLSGGGSGATGGRFYHEGGRFATVYQADGHVVQYEIQDANGNLRPESEWHQHVVWTNWHGLVRPLPW